MAEVTTRELVYIPPTELVADDNSREVDVMSPTSRELTASLKQHGQLQAIGVIRQTDGRYRIRFGYHRVFCGIEAELDVIRAEVIADEAVTPSTEIDRLSQQWEENEARRGYTTSEKAAMMLSLSMEGLSDSAIAKRLTGIKSGKTVKHARAVAASEIASEAVDHLALTLEQGAALAEFEGNQAAIDELLMAATGGSGRFEHALTRRRQLAAKEAGEREQRTALEAEGYRTVDETAGTPLDSLRTVDGNSISEAEHAECPGHVAWVEWEWVPNRENPRDSDHMWVKYVGCDQYDEFHYFEQAEDAVKLAEEQDRKRKEKRENRMARDNWDAAKEVREAFLTALLKRKTPPAGASLFVAESLIRGDYALRKAMQTDYPVGVELFGVAGKVPASQKANVWQNDGRHEDMLTLIDASTSEKKAQMLALGAVLVAYEQVEMHRDGWKNPSQERSRYLRYLEQIGYKLSDIELKSVEDYEKRAS